MLRTTSRKSSVIDNEETQTEEDEAAYNSKMAL